MLFLHQILLIITKGDPLLLFIILFYMVKIFDKANLSRTQKRP
jgi:hypothetical protein